MPDAPRVDEKLPRRCEMQLNTKSHTETLKMINWLAILNKTAWLPCQTNNRQIWNNGTSVSKLKFTHGATVSSLRRPPGNAGVLQR